jgi:hypothetical protein
MKQMQAEHPTPDPSRPQFLIGKDSHGHWVVQDERGLCGGLFVNRTEALHFAMFENGNRPQAMIMVPGVLELNLNGRASPREQRFPVPPRGRA